MSSAVLPRHCAVLRFEETARAARRGPGDECVGWRDGDRGRARGRARCSDVVEAPSGRGRARQAPRRRHRPRSVPTQPRKAASTRSRASKSRCRRRRRAKRAGGRRRRSFGGGDGVAALAPLVRRASSHQERGAGSRQRPRDPRRARSGGGWDRARGLRGAVVASRGPRRARRRRAACARAERARSRRAPHDRAVVPREAARASAVVECARAASRRACGRRGRVRPRSPKPRSLSEAPASRRRRPKRSCPFEQRGHAIVHRRRRRRRARAHRALVRAASLLRRPRTNSDVGQSHDHIQSLSGTGVEQRAHDRARAAKTPRSAAVARRSAGPQRAARGECESASTRTRRDAFCFQHHRVCVWRHAYGLPDCAVMAVERPSMP